MTFVAKLLKYSGTLLISHDQDSATYKVMRTSIVRFSVFLCVLSDSVYMVRTFTHNKLESGTDILIFLGYSLFNVQFMLTAYYIAQGLQAIAYIFSTVDPKNKKKFECWWFKILAVFYCGLIISFNSFAVDGYYITRQNILIKVICFLNDTYNSSIFLLINYILVSLRHNLTNCNTTIEHWQNRIRMQEIHRIRILRGNLLSAQHLFTSTFSLLILVILSERTIYVQINVYSFLITVYGMIFNPNGDYSALSLLQYCIWLSLDMVAVFAIFINCGRIETEVIFFIGIFSITFCTASINCFHAFFL
jgi:hypothetical protein